MASTTCEVCGTVTGEALVEHLEARHPGQMLHIDIDPATGVSTITAAHDEWVIPPDPGYRRRNLGLLG